MKKLIFLFILLITTFYLGFSQEYLDVIYLKNGSIIKGIIIEQTANQKIKLKTNDGSIFVYEFNEIEKIEKILKEKDETGHAISMEKTALGGYRFYQDNIKLSLSDIKMVVASNQKAYFMIKKAKRCYGWSYGLSAFGGINIGVQLGLVASGYDIEWSRIIVGTGSIIGSLIIWGKFKENAKNGIDIYNTDLEASLHHKFKPSLKLGVTNNGIGLVLNF